jgi:TAT (twin-arginine translocation) pathway-exported protein
MSNGKSLSTSLTSEANQQDSNDQPNSQPAREIQRRSFLKGLGVAGAALSAAPLLRVGAQAEDHGGSLTKGDVAILRFVAAAEIIESDIWLQYQELAGVQDSEVSQLASKLIPGYPSQPTGGNSAYTSDIKHLDLDMDQYIHDNTEDELTHEVFLNAYLASKGADTVSLDAFRTLPASQATGSNKTFGRITNLTQLTVHTDWWTRYRSRRGNPDLGDTFPNAIPTLAVGQHTAIPRTDTDVNDAGFLQVVANTAGFHFAWIEQGGSSLYPSLAQRATNAEVLRILLSIGGTEICHFQTWQDKAGNVVPVANVIDPVTGTSVTFPDLNSPPLGGENFQTNLIMPEPTTFLSRQFPPCSIIRPTETRGVAMGAVTALTADGLFIGQSTQFMQLLQDLASDADKAQRGGH